MKLQAELKPASELPNVYTSGNTIVVFYEKYIELFKFYNESCVIDEYGRNRSWEEMKVTNFKGWIRFEELKFELENEEEQKSEQLTIADLINEAKERGYKYITQDKNLSIWLYNLKPWHGVNKWEGKYPRLTGFNCNIDGVKKWYEGDWKNSLIEVK